MPDPFSLLLALTPTVIYLFTFGVIRCAGGAVVISKGTQTVLLGLAIIGMVAVGPAQLFFPTAAGGLFEGKVWIMLASFYLLCLSLFAMTIGGGVVVSGRTGEETFRELAELARALDDNAKIDVERVQVHLPTSGVHLRVESVPGIDHCTVLAFEPRVSPSFWQDLKKGLRGRLAPPRSDCRYRGVGMIAMAVALAGWMLFTISTDAPRLVEGMQQWLYHQ